MCCSKVSGTPRCLQNRLSVQLRSPLESSDFDDFLLILYSFSPLLALFFRQKIDGTLVATIHFTCCFRRVFKRSFTGFFRNENAEFTESLLCSLFAI